MGLIFSHSGSLGDLIYSLPVIKKMGGGELVVKLSAVEAVSKKYGYDTSNITEYQKSMINLETFELLKPLLEAQPYITSVRAGLFDSYADVDLDQFRGVLWRSFTGNYVEGYFKTFNLSYTADDINEPWLTAPVKTISDVIITRTERYRDDSSETTAKWNEILNLEEVRFKSAFIGLDNEYFDFITMFRSEVSHYKQTDFLDLASVINGANYFIGNQTFAYALATGLGKNTILETWKLRPLSQNECYFSRPGAQYF